MKKILSLCVVMSIAFLIKAATIDELRTPDFSGLNASEQEVDALRFLYAYMPLADVTDYPIDFYLENV